MSCVTVTVKIQCVTHLKCNTPKTREYIVSVTLLLNVLLSYHMCCSPDLGSVLQLIYTVLLTRLALFNSLFSCTFGQISCRSGQILVKKSKLCWKSRQIFENLRRPVAIQTKRWNSVQMNCAFPGTGLTYHCLGSLLHRLFLKQLWQFNLVNLLKWAIALHGIYESSESMSK